MSKRERDYYKVLDVPSDAQRELFKKLRALRQAGTD